MAVARRHGALKLGADCAQLATHQSLPLRVGLQASRDIRADLRVGEAEAAPAEVGLELAIWRGLVEAAVQGIPAAPAQVPVFQTKLGHQDGTGWPEAAALQMWQRPI